MKADAMDNRANPISKMSSLSPFLLVKELLAPDNNIFFGKNIFEKEGIIVEKNIAQLLFFKT